MSTIVSNNTPSKIMVFRPTWNEFKNFKKYIKYMESKGAHRAGIAKVVPPPEYVPNKQEYANIDTVIIPNPIRQIITGEQGLYQQFAFKEGNSICVKEFRKLAEKEEYRAPTHINHEDLERSYWQNIRFGYPVYGADVSNSLMDPEVKYWNLNRLQTILDTVKNEYGQVIEGINSPYLYFGMWKTTFAWHVEDKELYSINYLHIGQPKSWYSIPPQYGKRFEKLVASLFPSKSKLCTAFIRHKMCLISPFLLEQYGIPFDKITQEKGEFIITFPFGYHSGYNHGFNCAEAVNFAMPRWIDYGKRALECHCSDNVVRISMDAFVKKYQPERYESWSKGKDWGCHPEDFGEYCYAPSRSISNTFTAKTKRNLDNDKKVKETIPKKRKSESNYPSRIEKMQEDNDKCSLVGKDNNSTEASPFSSLPTIPLDFIMLCIPDKVVVEPQGEAKSIVNQNDSSLQRDYKMKKDKLSTAPIASTKPTTTNTNWIVSESNFPIIKLVNCEKITSIEKKQQQSCSVDTVRNKLSIDQIADIKQQLYLSSSSSSSSSCSTCSSCYCSE